MILEAGLQFHWTFQITCLYSYLIRLLLNIVVQCCNDSKNWNYNPDLNSIITRLAQCQRYNFVRSNKPRFFSFTSVSLYPRQLTTLSTQLASMDHHFNLTHGDINGELVKIKSPAACDQSFNFRSKKKKKKNTRLCFPSECDDVPSTQMDHRITEILNWKIMRSFIHKCRPRVSNSSEILILILRIK